MDAYEFFVAKHRRDIVWDNISKLRCAYHYKQFGKYYPTAIRYLGRLSKRYKDNADIVSAANRLKHRISVEYWHRLLTGQMMIPLIRYPVWMMFAYIDNEMHIDELRFYYYWDEEDVILDDPRNRHDNRRNTIKTKK